MLCHRGFSRSAAECVGCVGFNRCREEEDRRREEYARERYIERGIDAEWEDPDECCDYDEE